VAGVARKQDPPAAASTLEELANAAAFMASDQASGMTGTTVNLTMGNLDD
jgi:enoyl-[acyl-carrier-protein] reductase (NADH)